MGFYVTAIISIIDC